MTDEIKSIRQTLSKLPTVERAFIEDMAASLSMTAEEYVAKHGLRYPDANGAANEQSQESTVPDDDVEVVFSTNNSPEVSAALSDLPPEMEEAPAETKSPASAFSEQIAADAPELPIANYICVNCGWDQKNPVIAEPTEDDKVSFLVSCRLGDRPFFKTMSILGDSLKLTFRTLFVPEVDEILNHLYDLQVAGVVRNASEHNAMLQQYRLALSLSRIETTDGQSRSFPSTLRAKHGSDRNDSWEYLIESEKANEQGDKLVTVVHRYVLDRVCRIESTYRLYMTELAKFNRFVSVLEMHASDVNFYKGIGRPT